MSDSVYVRVWYVSWNGGCEAARTGVRLNDLNDDLSLGGLQVLTLTVMA